MFEDAPCLPYAGEELATLPTVPPPSTPKKAPALTVEPLEDDGLNGLSPEETIGGTRLRAIDEENTRFLRDQQEAAKRAVELPREEARTPEPALYIPETAPLHTIPEKSIPTVAPAPARRPAPVIRDPMQMTADDILPRAPKATPAPTKATPAAPKPAAASTGNAPLYTDAMAKKEGEEGRLRETELLMDLGYESNLHAPEEQRRAEAVHARNATRTEDEPTVAASAVKEKHRTASAPITEDTNAFFKSFVPMAIALVGALLGLLMDFLPLFVTGNEGLSAFTNSFAYPLLEMAWIALVSALFIVPLGKGYKGILDFTPTRYSLPAVALTATLLHSAVSIFVPVADRAPLFGGAALLMLATASVAECLRVSADDHARSVVTSGKDVYLFTDEETPAARALTASLEAEGKSKKNKHNKGKILTAVSARRLADFSSRLNRTNPYMRRLNYLLPVALLSAIVAGGAAVAFGGTVFGDGLSAFTATYLCALPAAYLCAMTLPLWQANRILHEKGTTVVGEDSVDFYAGKATHLIFPDGDAITPLYRKEITLRNDSDPEHWRRLAALTFRLMESPMASEGDDAHMDTDGYRLEAAEQEAGYARFYLTDNRNGTAVEVMMGTHDALVRRGIRLPKINMEERYKKSRDSHVIYLAFDRRFHLAYSVEYRVGNRFTSDVCELNAAGHRVSLCSYDPFVRKENSCLASFFEEVNVGLLTPDVVELKRKSRAGGLVATGKSPDLLYPFAACRRIRLSYRFAQLIAWLNIPLSLGISMLLCYLGLGGILTAATAVLWQILAVAAVILMDLLTVNRDKLGLSPRTAPAKENNIDSD